MRAIATPSPLWLLSRIWPNPGPHRTKTGQLDGDVVSRQHFLPVCQTRSPHAQRPQRPQRPQRSRWQAELPFQLRDRHGADTTTAHQSCSAVCGGGCSGASGRGHRPRNRSCGPAVAVRGNGRFPDPSDPGRRTGSAGSGQTEALADIKPSFVGAASRGRCPRGRCSRKLRGDERRRACYRRPVCGSGARDGGGAHQRPGPLATLSRSATVPPGQLKSSPGHHGQLAVTCDTICCWVREHDPPP